MNKLTLVTYILFSFNTYGLFAQKQRPKQISENSTIDYQIKDSLNNCSHLENLQLKTMDNELLSTSTITPTVDVDRVCLNSIEKSEILLYNTNKYVDGLYYTYHSFSSQIPDNQMNVKIRKNGKIARVSIYNEANEEVKVYPRDVYAFIYKGIPFIATDCGYYPLIKSNDEFYFTGKIKVAPSADEVVVATLMFGIVGTLLSQDSKSEYVIKLDWMNGNYILQRKIIYDLD